MKTRSRRSGALGLIGLLLLTIATATSAAWAAGDPQGALHPAADGHIRVVCEGQQVDMPVAEAADGECYVALSDESVAQLFAMYGLSIRWSESGPRTATLYAHGHYVHWAVGARRGLVDGSEATWPTALLIARKDDAAVSLRALAQLLDFRLRPQGTAGTYRFVPRLQKIVLHASADREVHLRASAPLDAPRVETDGTRTTITLANVEWGFEARAFDFGDVQVRCAGTGTETDPATIVVTVPAQWKTECNAQLLQSQITVRVVPDFTAAFNRAPETLRNLRQIRGLGDSFLALDTTGPLQTLWRFDPQTRLLVIDVPNATIGAQALPSDGDILGVETEDLRTTAFPVARIRVRLREGSGFELDTEDDRRLMLRVAPVAILPISALSGGDLGPAQTGHGIIVIDPGHGGSDPGAVNRSLGLCEKNVTLDISLRLRTALEGRGFQVVLTREDDRDVSWARSPDKVELEARANVANSRNADIFVSIHCNSATSSVYRGTSYHWYKRADLALAQALEGSLCNGTGFANKGLIRNRFYVLRRTAMPAVLVETAFLSNSADAAQLADPQVRQRIADNLAEALTVKFAAGRLRRQQGISTRRP